MIGWITGAASKVWFAIAGAAIFVAAGVVLVARIMAAGRAAERAAALERANRARSKADEVDARIDGASRSDLDGLRGKWTRH